MLFRSEKVLLLNRNKDSDLSNAQLVNSDGNFEINEDEKLKLLALRAKLKSFGNEDGIVKNNNTYTIKVGEEEKNFAFKDSIIDSRVTKTIEILYIEITKDSLTQTKFNTVITNNTPYNEIYQIVKKDSENNESFIKRQENFFKDQITEKLLDNKNSKDMLIYNNIKGLI